MTGIERLREFAKGCRLTGQRAYSNAIGDIADQIEREQRRDPAADVSVSAYDLLPEEDREAVAWVREHGGIAYVKDAWNVRSNLDRQLAKERAKVERQQRHIEFVQGKCRERRERVAELSSMSREADYRRVELCSALGIDPGTGWADAMVAMHQRLMPEGMEWPMFEDGEPVRVGDEVVDEAEEFVYRVSEIAFSDGYGTCLRYEDQRDGNSYNFIDGLEPGQLVRRPEPKVLDADGAEIRVGDTVWLTDGRGPWSVSRIVYADRLRVICDDEKNGHLNVFPESITHRAPVLAADGRPLREGETVYEVDCGDEHIVGGFLTKTDGQVVVQFRGEGGCIGFYPKYLTHERPDSLERIADDIAKMSASWKSWRLLGDAQREAARQVGAETMGAALDSLVRRAKALAERDR